MINNNIYRQVFEIKGKDFARAGEVSLGVKNILREIGFDAKTIRRAAIASYEAELNIVMYAEHGKLQLMVMPEKIMLEVEDIGQGIEDIELALQEGYSTASPEMREMGFGAGMGLPNIVKNSDKFDIESTVGRGTKLSIEVLAKPHGA